MRTHTRTGPINKPVTARNGRWKAASVRLGWCSCARAVHVDEPLVLDGPAYYGRELAVVITSNCGLIDPVPVKVSFAE